MLDTIYYRSKKEVILIFTHRSPVILWSGNGRVIEFLDEFLAPLYTDCITLSQWKYRVKIEQEDTQVIDLEEVA